MACGDGPIDAIFLAIEELTGISVVCKDFSVHSVTVGKDAQGEVMVQVEHNGQAVPRPRRLDRQRRGQRQGVPQRHQPHCRDHSRRQAGSGVGSRPASGRPIRPIGASTIRRIKQTLIVAEWRNGRRSGFKILWA